jgi:hypothetical protein
LLLMDEISTVESANPRWTMNALTRAVMRASSSEASGRVARCTDTDPRHAARSLVIGLRDDPVTVISSPARRNRSTARLPMSAATTTPAASTTAPQKVGAPSTPRSFVIGSGAPASGADI